MVGGSLVDHRGWRLELRGHAEIVGRFEREQRENVMGEKDERAWEKRKRMERKNDHSL